MLVQAAQYFAREAYSDDRIASLSPLTSSGERAAIHVVLRGDQGPNEVILNEKLSEPLLSQCQREGRGPGAGFRAELDQNRVTPAKKKWKGSIPFHYQSISH